MIHCMFQTMVCFWDTYKQYAHVHDKLWRIFGTPTKIENYQNNVISGFAGFCVFFRGFSRNTYIFLGFGGSRPGLWSMMMFIELPRLRFQRLLSANRTQNVGQTSRTVALRCSNLTSSVILGRFPFWESSMAAKSPNWMGIDMGKSSINAIASPKWPCQPLIRGHFTPKKVT